MWIAKEPKIRQCLEIRVCVCMSYEKEVSYAEHFIHSFVKKYRKYSVSTDGGHMMISLNMESSDKGTIFIHRLRKALLLKGQLVDILKRGLRYD